MVEAMRDRSLVAISGIGAGCFLACYAVAIALYPGGTWYDVHAEGHSLTKNFLCDLMQERALNGHEAPVGSLLARVGMVAMLLSLAAFYEQIARFESPITGAGSLARRAGWIACVLGCAVPLATSDRVRVLHLVSVVGAFVPSLVATIAALLVCLRAPRVSRWLRGAAVLTLGAGAIDGLLYAFVYASPELGLVPESREVRQLISAALPLLQRVATVGVLVWVGAVCVHTTARASAHPATL